MIDKKMLDEMMEAFHSCTSLAIEVIDDTGATIIRKGETCSFCTTIQKYMPKSDTCSQQHLTASRRSVDFGGSYIFSCHADLNHITYPLLRKGKYFGAVLVGPFLMTAPDSILIQDIAGHYTIPLNSLLELYDSSADIPIIQPALITQISRLLSFLFDALITDSSLQFIANRNKLLQQSQINESIQMYKNSGEISKDKYPIEKEHELLLKVREGNESAAKGILNDLIGYVLFSSGNDINLIKSRSIELSSLLSRTAIEGGAFPDMILKINDNFLSKLTQVNDMETLCLDLQEILVAFTNSVFKELPCNNNELLKKTYAYISQNYSNQITLNDVANYVHLNPAYFSTVFKKASGYSFSYYLNSVRIEESKRLLSNTDYSILDIAIASGFQDQSYFTKIFKKITGLTPKQFR